MDRRTLISRLAVEEEDAVALAQFLDKSAQAERGSMPAATAFFNPRQQTLSDTLAKMTRVCPYVFCGGYEEAERRLAVFLPDWAQPEDAAQYAPLVVLRARWAAQTKASLSHRDFLGALMGCGVRRDTIGDILAGDESCDLVVLESVARYIEENLVSVGRASVSLSRIDPAGIAIPERRVRLIRDTLASLRLDAAVSTGFSMSRERAQELIRTGHCVLNNLPCEKPDRAVAEGDVVSARGFGKFRISSVGALSRKGRIFIEVEKYE